jgi:hypothetical protein
VDAYLRALAFRVARIEERIGEVGDSLARLWTLFERRAGSIAAPPAPTPTPQSSLEPRVGASEAARLLGCDASTVRRHIRAGRLAGAAIQIPGTTRRRWTIATSSIERLVGAALSPAPARSKPDSAGFQRSREKG